MARKRTPHDADRFLAFLLSKDDLTAVIHGLSSLEAIMDESLDALSVERHLHRRDAFESLRILEKAAVLIVAGRLPAEAYPLLKHLTGIRNSFAHRLQTQITPEQDLRAYELLPKRPDDDENDLTETQAGMLVRRAIVIVSFWLYDWRPMLAGPADAAPVTDASTGRVAG